MSSPYASYSQERDYIDSHVFPGGPQQHASSPRRNPAQAPAPHHHKFLSPAGSYSEAMGKENAASPKFAAAATAGRKGVHTHVVHSSERHHRASPAGGYSSALADEAEPRAAAAHRAAAPKFEDQRRKPKQSAGAMKGSKYWELGKLGPDLERKDIQEKRSARDKMKEFSSEIRRNNARVTRKAPKASDRGASTMDSSKAYSARQRALNFAKNIPKPAALQKGSSPTSEKKAQKEVDYDNLSELDKLMAKHEQDSQQVNLMRNQLERMKLASI